MKTSKLIATYAREIQDKNYSSLTVSHQEQQSWERAESN